MQAIASGRRHLECGRLADPSGTRLTLNSQTARRGRTRHARAQLRDGDLTVTLDFQFGDDGLIESMRSETRGRSVGGQMLPTPWEGRMSNYQRVAGMLVPLDGEVAWLVDGERRPYWRGRIVEIEHQY